MIGLKRSQNKVGGHICPNPMQHSPRHGKILQLLSREGVIGVAELARRLQVSAETLRRDVRAMARRGEVLRMHGSVGLPSVAGEAPFERRLRENRAAKEAIAHTAAATIRDGASVMLDSGTTTALLARALRGHRRLTVVTNSSDIARTLATLNGNKVYMAGGELRSDDGAALGHAAIEFVRRFRVDHAIISAGAVNCESGVLDHAFEEAEFGRAVLACGRRRVVVTDNSKFGRPGLVRVCGLADIDELIAEAPPPADLAAALKAAGTALRLGDETPAAGTSRPSPGAAPA